MQKQSDAGKGSCSSKSCAEWQRRMMGLTACTLIGLAASAHAQTFDVYTLPDLQKVGSGVDGWTAAANYRLMNDIDAWATADWNDAATSTAVLEGFMPIGSFTGVFDGQGHTISGLSISRSETANVGLFSSMQGVVRNLTLTDVSVSGHQSVGGLAGLASGTVEGCFVSGWVWGDEKVGGMIGEGGGQDFIMACCGSAGEVTGNTWIGGLIGDAGCSGAITDCHSSADVSGEECVGGFANCSCCTSLLRCYATGDVQGNSTAEEEKFYFGGLAGYSAGRIERCFAMGDVAGGDWGCGVGGLAGLVTFNPVINCYATGDTSGCGYVGRLIGLNGFLDEDYGMNLDGADVSSCYATGTQVDYCMPGAGGGVVAGLIGWDFGQVSGSYWDMDTGGVPVTDQAVNRASGGRTSAEMRQQTTFAGWDFARVWVLQQGARSPYLRAVGNEIRTLADLQKVGSGVDGWTPGAFYRLMNDIDASATAGWNDQGTSAAALEGFKPIRDFYGVFDGQGFTVLRLTVNRPTTSEVGLFSVLNGTVRNLALMGATIRGMNDVGGLAGCVSWGATDIEQCYVSGSVSGGDAVGGLIGGLDLAFQPVSLCGTEGTVTGVNYVGGLFGAAGCGGLFSSCYSRATVTGESYVGGLAGGFHCTSLRRCFATGMVTGTAENTEEDGWQQGVAYGGLVGYSAGLVEECFATGTVMGGDEGNGVGALVGIKEEGLVTNCFATGTAEGCGYAGRLIGLNGCDDEWLIEEFGLDIGGGAVRYCYATGLQNGYCTPVTEFAIGLIGSDLGQLDDAYWNMDTGGIPAAEQAANRASGGRTTAEMRQQATFAGWDFVNVWGIQPGVGSPYLRALMSRSDSFDSQGGSAIAGSVVVGGTLYGQLPISARAGYVFDGWWTGPGGTGTRVTTLTVVPAAGQTLYARWMAVDVPSDIPDPYVCDSESGVPTTAGSYDGYFYQTSDFAGEPVTAVRGTLMLKLTDAVGGKLTAKAVLQNGTLSFSASRWTSVTADQYTHVSLNAKSGEILDLLVSQDRVWGTLSKGSLGGEMFNVDGARNRFAIKSDTAAQTLLEKDKGYYTVALPAAVDGLSLGEADAAPKGVGYLTVTVGAGGSAKIAGVLADGTKVTQASRLIFFDGCGAGVCVPFFTPLYSKQGWAGGLLWISPENRTVVTHVESGCFLRWEKPGSGPDGFSLLLNACGGYYGTTAALASAYLFSAELEEVPYHYTDGTADWVTVPEDVPVTVAGMRMNMAKGTKPVKEDGEYFYDGENVTLATLIFTAKTGLFKGKYSLYYDYDDAADRLQHKTVNVPYAGVLTPVRDAGFTDLPEGMGHCLVPDNDPAVKAYRLKRSFPVMLRAEP